MRVSAGQAIKASHFNALDTRIDAIQGAVASNSTGYQIARVEPYHTVPDFSGTIHPNGTVSVSPGTVYVNGNIVRGDEIPYRHTSITDYTSSAQQAAADGVTAWLTGYAKWQNEELSAEFKIAWTQSPDKAPDKPQIGSADDYTIYAFPIIAIKTNASGVLYVYQYFTGPQYLTIQIGDPVLAQYNTDNPDKPDTPGIIAAIQRIPYDQWHTSPDPGDSGDTENTENTQDTGDTSTDSNKEYIEDGVIYLLEPAPTELAQYLAQDTTKPDTPGIIAAVKRIPYEDWKITATTYVDGTYDLATSGVEFIEDGVIYLREPPQYPIAQYYTQDNLRPDRTGVIRAVNYTTGIDSPRIFDGEIQLPITGGSTTQTQLAQYLAGDESKPDTPGIIAGIQRIPFSEWSTAATTNVDGTYDLTTSGVEHITDGVIYLREPVQYTLANYNSGDPNLPDNPGIIAAIAYTSGIDSPNISNGTICLPDLVFDSNWFSVSNGTVSLKAENLQTLANEIVDELAVEVEVSGVLENVTSINKIVRYNASTTAYANSDSSLASTSFDTQVQSVTA